MWTETARIRCLRALGALTLAAVAFQGCISAAAEDSETHCVDGVCRRAPDGGAPDVDAAPLDASSDGGAPDVDAAPFDASPDRDGPPTDFEAVLACDTAEDCPAVPLAACEDHLCVDSQGDPVSAWIGAACRECTLDAQLALLTQPGAESCGTAVLDDGAASLTCARSAFEEQRPFVLIIEGQGTDSNVSTAWAFDGEELIVLSYDSNVCGGGSTCPSGPQRSPICGPMIRGAICQNPTATEGGVEPFSCASRVDSVVCGPSW